ncbi:MAG: transposase [Terriglobia bacterium]
MTSERRLVEEVRMHLAYRWFTRIGLEQEVPDHSTFSKNRHGRFRESGIFLEIFEEIVRRCPEAWLVEGQRLTVDGTAVTANASSRSKVHRKQLAEVAKVSRTVREYLEEVRPENPVADTADRPPAPRSMAAQMVSKTDPDACWVRIFISTEKPNDTSTQERGCSLPTQANLRSSPSTASGYRNLLQVLLGDLVRPFGRGAVAGYQTLLGITAIEKSKAVPQHVFFGSEPAGGFLHCLSELLPSTFGFPSRRNDCAGVVSQVSDAIKHKTRSSHKAW